ncbi:Beta carbonic anhydrase 5, chloroplastic [Vitis vinifera]|uniref:Carbonic anhydrase n=1 Tax=Vitis vinifera TaxID=29760 RepID=A0A438F7V4_VITVI|nr:Beta carbonic anhydrase 5, chloroplastic [Vitis vinifera]
MAALRPSSVSFDSSVSGPTNSFMGLLHKSPIFDSRKNWPHLVVELAPWNWKLEPLVLIQHSVTFWDWIFFEELKHRFLCFKKAKVPGRTRALSSSCQSSISKDSRVCPSNILGFQPGEAFMIRNVANLVPPVENGPSETNAALEFAVNTLEVENILVIGHSSCAGIETLVRMRDDVNSSFLSQFISIFSSFVENWVANGKVAKLRTKAAAGHLGFYQQCKYWHEFSLKVGFQSQALGSLCKLLNFISVESINHSLLNLLTYPWIEDRERKGLLSIHGGYYDFLNCTFEKWTIDFKRSSIEKEGPKCLVKNRAFWC